MRKPTKFGSKEGIEKGNKEGGKVPREDPGPIIEVDESIV